MKVIVIGAGIGGLTLAVALRRRGFEVSVLEKRATFADEGAGIVLGPNVMAALRAISLDAAVAAVARPLEEMNITDVHGRVLAGSSTKIAELPLVAQAVHRSRLHEVLRAAFDGELRTGVEVSGIEPGKVPTVRTGDSVLQADLIVGADGIRSVVRQRLSPDFVTRYSGYTCWRFVCDSQWTTAAFEMWGPGKRVGVVPIGQNRTYVFLTANAPRRAPSPFSDVAGLSAMFAEFGGPAPQAFASLSDFSRVLHNDLEDGIAPRFWAPGVVLLGDAAHAVTPNLGQGAGLAIEDGCCLAALLESGERDAQLARYEALRKPRAAWICDNSYFFGRLAQLDSAPLRWLRDSVVRLTPAKQSQAMYRRIVTDMPGVPIKT